MCERFLEAGVSAAYIDGNTDRPAREAIFDGFRAGKVKVIVSVATLTAGIDLPSASCVIDARPTKSEIAWVQWVGRGLRTAPGKTNCILLDHAGNALRLGLPSDISHDRLDDGDRRKGRQKPQERTTPLPRLCGECKAVLPPSVTRCSACGTVREAKTAVLVHEGELVEFGSGQSGKREATIAEKASFYSEVLWIGREKRYAPGWAANQYRERFGVWPNDARIWHVEPSAPSLKTKQWILSRQIAYAKGRRAHG